MLYRRSSPRATPRATLASAPLPCCQAVKANSGAGAARYPAGAQRTMPRRSRSCDSTPAGSIKDQARSRTGTWRKDASSAAAGHRLPAAAASHGLCGRSRPRGPRAPVTCRATRSGGDSPVEPHPPDLPAALAAELAGAPWGAPPGLYLIGLQDGRYALDLFPVPERLWRELPPDTVITAAAALGSEIIAGGRLHPSYAGTAVRLEVWDLPWPLLLGPARDQARADLAAGLVYTRPDRIERRYLFAAGRDGTSWMATQLRTQPVPRTATYPAGTVLKETLGAYRALRVLNRAIFGPQGPVPEP
jgi:hypothetical protein